eukprot:TRINITY_DN1149_c0_g2_i16.p1 TRINITY_DN1149_c0_g2~~TRINITY_DN1149_c0_g2_i16.p1  ORF type:complete len:195 (+),score=60.78 TRINITY_DN1149_c0_g2_i16:234-818(+)
MASSKLRRTPLFGYDGNLGIPIIPSSGSGSHKPSPSGSSSGYEYQNRESLVNPSGMDVGITAHRSAYSGLDNGSSSMASPRLSDTPPSTPHKQVNFGSTTAVEEKKREKFLTAKYGAHQMALIRKRLKVEMWMYDKLQELYGTDEVEIDLDEVLDMDEENERRDYIFNLLNTAKAPRDSLNVFVGDLLAKVKTL